jgi:hypothetical protein
MLRPIPAGQTLGVITLNEPGEAALVLVQVECADLSRELEPEPPERLEPEAVSMLYQGAALALLLADQYDVRDVRRAFRFRVRQVDGSPLDVPARIAGGSLGLAALVATWSLLSNQPVCGGLVFTGCVGTRGKELVLHRVSHVAIKAQEVFSLGARLVLPHTNVGELPSTSNLQAVEDVPQALEVAFGSDWSASSRRPPPAGDLKTVEEHLEQDYWAVRGGWAMLAERFECFAERTHPNPRRSGKALARAGACWTHLNEMEKANHLLARAGQVLASARHELRISDALEISNHLAVFYRDSYRFEEAIQKLTGILCHPRVDPHSREAVDARSTLGQILVCTGQWDEGLPHVEAARDYYDQEEEPGCSRNHTYVVDALARAGALEEARKEHALGSRHNRERNAQDPSAMRRNQAYLDYALVNGELRALRAVSDPEEWNRLAILTKNLPGATEVGVWPGIALERVRDAIQLRRVPSSADRDRIRQAALSGATELFPLFSWHRALVSVEAALSELDRGGDTSLARTWLEEGLRKMPGFEGAQRFFAPYLLGIRNAGDPEALMRAIRALLDAEQY